MCKDLKYGSIGAGIWSMVAGSLLLGFRAWYFSQNFMEEKIEKLELLINELGREYKQEKLDYVFCIVDLVLFSLWILCAFVLIVSVFHRSKCLMFPWFLVSIILTGFCLYKVVSSLPTIGDQYMKDSSVIGWFLATVCVSAINIYTMYLVYSHLKKMQREDDQNEARDTRRKMMRTVRQLSVAVSDIGRSTHLLTPTDSHSVSSIGTVIAYNHRKKPEGSKKLFNLFKDKSENVPLKKPGNLLLKRDLGSPVYMDPDLVHNTASPTTPVYINTEVLQRRIGT